MAVITISRQIGSSGEAIARGVAEHLGFVFIDRAGLEDLVLTYGLDEVDLPRIQERPPNFLERLYSDRKLYLQLVESFIRDTAEYENFVLIGRGGQCVFKDSENAFHVRVVASERNRIENLVEAESLEREKARSRLIEAERTQQRFVETLYGRSIDDPYLYDLVLRTDQLDVRACVHLIIHAVGQRSLTVHLQSKDVPEKTSEAEGVAGSRVEKTHTFANTSEEAFAKILDFYRIRWEYEPRTFQLEWDEEGLVKEAFSPDFYLVDSDTYIELTTLRQSLVTKKNRKLRRLKELYPEVNVRIFYKRDYQNLLIKYGLVKTK